jgi:hypothetical protein
MCRLRTRKSKRKEEKYMLSDQRASEIPQFVVVLAIVVVLGAVAVWGILTNVGAQGDAVSNWVSSLAVPASHP